MADLSEVYTDEIFDRLDSNNFPSMAGKPKLVFFDLDGSKELFEDFGLLLPKPDEAHQKIGKTTPLEPIQIARSSAERTQQEPIKMKELSTPIIDELGSKVACKADFLILLASFPRFKALHNKYIGSISTRVLVETFYKHAHRLHAEELAKKIRRKLDSKLIDRKKQVLTTVDTLNRYFYMFPVLP